MLGYRSCSLGGESAVSINVSNRLEIVKEDTPHSITAEKNPLVFRVNPLADRKQRLKPSVHLYRRTC